MDVTGASADAYLYVSASSAASIGTLTVGGLDLSVNANVDAAVSEHATATVDLFNDGDIVIGDVSFNVGDAKGANPVTDANNFNFSISATGDVTLGVVSVTGGDQGLINGASFDDRSEEHTSELQSLMRISYAVFCLKKKKTIS